MTMPSDFLRQYKASEVSGEVPVSEDISATAPFFFQVAKATGNLYYINMETKIATLEAHVGHIQSDIGEIKTDIKEFRSEVKADLSSLRAGADKVKWWMIGTLVSVSLMLAGTLISILVKMVFKS